MYVAVLGQHLLRALTFPLPIRVVSTFLSPTFAALVTFATYALTQQLHSPGAGLLAAAFVAVAPPFATVSVAGEMENECVAFFLLLLTFSLWLRALAIGSVWWSAMCALSFFGMVNAWGGYVFVINLIAVHVLALLVLGRFSLRAYVAFSTFVTLATLLAMQVRFVGFQAVKSSEHLLPLVVFVVVQLRTGAQTLLQRRHAAPLVRVAVLGAFGVGAMLVAGSVYVAFARGLIEPWSDRLWSLFDPYGSKDIPIIASVSEHKPPTAAQFLFSLHVLLLFAPTGLWHLSQRFGEDERAVFALVFATTTLYFSGVMERLVIVYSVVASVVAGIGASVLLARWTPLLPNVVACAVVCGTLALAIEYVVHCTWLVAAFASSSTTVLSAFRADGTQHTYDEYRSAYRWLNQNTPHDAVVMAWWDHGYEIASFANRTLLIDNNTRNHTQMAIVANAFVTDEATAYDVALRFDVGFVLVRSGALVGYANDDISKILAMVRFARLIDTTISEEALGISSRGFSVGAFAGPALRATLLYKLSYFRYGAVATSREQPPGFDNARQDVIADRRVTLTYFEEVFTTDNWLVRIFQVKKPKR